MSNLIQRLRAMENDLYYSEAERCLARNAADEIERLERLLALEDTPPRLDGDDQ